VSTFDEQNWAVSVSAITRDVRGFATEVRSLGYSPAAGGHENPFLELSDRMMQRADNLDRAQ
jgi:hypothetical protein